VTQAPANVAATVTAHHLLYNRNAMFQGGMRPHYYCLPVLKRETPPPCALVEAATGGNPKFFLGTDSAPTPRRQGGRLRLRRHLHRPCRPGVVRGSLRGWPARWTSWKPSPASTARISTACRAIPDCQRRHAMKAQSASSSKVMLYALGERRFAVQQGKNWYFVDMQSCALQVAEAPKEGESGTLVGNWQKKDRKLVFLPAQSGAGSTPAARSAE
jgi:hypothetical protein